jgi:hypothetical protein
MHWTRLLVTYLCVWDVVLQGRQEEDGEHTYSVHQCILGTHTSGDAQNYLIIEGLQRQQRLQQHHHHHYYQHSMQ